MNDVAAASAVMEKQEDSASAPDIRALNERIGQASQFVDLLRMELNKVIVGQKKYG
jgi:MoxR-like ATPase